jgi:hypothetical protein
MMDGTDRAEKQSKLRSALKHDRRAAMLYQMLYGAVGCALLANEFRFRPACSSHRASQRATPICAITLLPTNAALFSFIGSGRFSVTADCQSAGAQTRFRQFWNSADQKKSLRPKRCLPTVSPRRTSSPCSKSPVERWCIVEPDQ